MDIQKINASLPEGASGFKLVGEPIEDFWMWNRKVIKYEDGTLQFRTVKVELLREAAFHYWRDGWQPMKPITEEFLRKMEQALRMHPGLQMQGVQLPDGKFLEMPQALPEGIKMPGAEINSVQVSVLSSEEFAAMKRSLLTPQQIAAMDAATN